jgi:hypothetical protein
MAGLDRRASFMVTRTISDVVTFDPAVLVQPISWASQLAMHHRAVLHRRTTCCAQLINAIRQIHVGKSIEVHHIKSPLDV